MLKVMASKNQDRSCSFDQADGFSQGEFDQHIKRKAITQKERRP
ncbi:MAG: hypothetical protein BMS9Abin15_0051 [Gammaproteobacteria bacterium]|nr:MAG: hypothetical protein BMS9Abin15_0051 [Gammaproteobacteria bacterium]